VVWHELVMDIPLMPLVLIIAMNCIVILVLLIIVFTARFAYVIIANNRRSRLLELSRPLADNGYDNDVRQPNHVDGTDYPETYFPPDIRDLRMTATHYLPRAS